MATITTEELNARIEERQQAIELMQESEAVLRLLFIDEQSFQVDRNTVQRAMRIALDKLNEARGQLAVGLEIARHQAAHKLPA